MSDTPEETRPDQINASSSSSSNGAAVQPCASAGDDDKATAPIEKTISCVSCRKRKLRCDRVKPKCGTCSRLRHECEYPERRRNLGSKRRNMKELEARLAQVETQLVAETSKNTPPSKDETPPNQSGEPDWNNYPMDINMDFDNDALLDFPIPESTYAFQPQIPNGDFFSQEVISLGLQEPLPPDEMIEELHHLYFEKFHFTMPMIHKNRYLAALHLPAHMRPPVCLRYAIWATAASMSEKYRQYDDMLYERARRYIDQAEMKGMGETFVTVSHAQCWSLICTYEARKTYFTRAWMSTGRVVRLCQMLGLHRLDADPAVQDAKQILQPPKDWIELEERRRTFWAAFYGDRWASSGTGWPMNMDEKLITTHLPASEEAYEHGTMETSISLHDALVGEGVSKISPFGGVILSACLFGHNFEHLHTYGPNERQDDLENGDFWKRHRKMDNVLSNTFMFLPDHLRLPGGVRDMNIVFLHMNIHSSAICLHQAAVLTAERNNISQSFIRQSRARSLMAAEEIANIMKLISHLDTSNMNSWMGFCLYVASGVFIQDLRSEQKSLQSMTNLEFLVSAMKALGKTHSITQHFTAQVEIDIENSGVTGNSDGPSRISPPKGVSVPGVLPGEGTMISQVCPFNAATQLADKGQIGDWGPIKQRPLLGIYPSARTTQQPGNHSFTDFTTSVVPPLVGGQDQTPPESTDSYGARGYTYLGLDSTETGPGVHNLTKATGYHYGAPTTNQDQSPPENPTAKNHKNYATQMSGSIDPSAPFDMQGFQSAVLSRFIDDKDSPETQASNSSGSGSAKAPTWYGRYPFADDANPANASNHGSRPSVMAADGVMNLTTFLSGNPSNFTSTQYPYRQIDPSDLNKSPYTVFPNDRNAIDDATDATGWSFDPRGIKEMCSIPSHPREPHTHDDWKDWNGDSGPS